jgi:hypothetical protein
LENTRFNAGLFPYPIETEDLMLYAMAAVQGISFAIPLLELNGNKYSYFKEHNNETFTRIYSFPGSCFVSPVIAPCLRQEAGF